MLDGKALSDTRIDTSTSGVSCKTELIPISLASRGFFSSRVKNVDFMTMLFSAKNEYSIIYLTILTTYELFHRSDKWPQVSQSGHPVQNLISRQVSESRFCARFESSSSFTTGQ